jgi:hypothetical protein
MLSLLGVTGRLLNAYFAVHFMFERKAPLVETHNAENANN